MATNTTEEPTPPGYEAASSSQQTTTDSLPIYNEEEHTGSNSFLHLRNALANTHRDRAHDVEIWQQYIKHAPSTKTSRDETETLVIRNEFISAIDHEQIDVIRFLIGHDFVTADSARDTRLYEQIPLLRAVFNGKAEVVRTLVDLGADTDVFGSVVRSPVSFGEYQLMSQDPIRRGQNSPNTFATSCYPGKPSDSEDPSERISL